MKTQLKTYLLCGACAFGTMVNASEDIPTPLSSITLGFFTIPQEIVQSKSRFIEPLLSKKDYPELFTQQQTGTTGDLVPSEHSAVSTVGRDVIHHMSGMSSDNSFFVDQCLFIAQRSADNLLEEYQGEKEKKDVRPKNAVEAVSHFQKYLNVFVACQWNVVPGLELKYGAKETQVNISTALFTFISSVAKGVLSAGATAVCDVLLNRDKNQNNSTNFVIFDYCTGSTNFNSLCMGETTNNDGVLRLNLLYLYYNASELKAGFLGGNTKKRKCDFYVRSAFLSLAKPNLFACRKLVSEIATLEHTRQFRQSYAADPEILKLHNQHMEERERRKLQEEISSISCDEESIRDAINSDEEISRNNIKDEQRSWMLL
ncbi:MAG TPA: hypothetical protein DIC42_06290 [Holosporales bacterium]|nr:hypothetical protein [Holosporales bacterium]